VADTPAAQPPSTPVPETPRPRERTAHEVVFTTFPKLLFIWPIIVLGFALWPFAAPDAAPAATTPPATTAVVAPAAGPTSAPATAHPVSPRLEHLGWLYIAVVVLVILTLGVDIDRNMAAFWVILFGGLFVLGLWLRDVKHFTLFGNIYAWFAALNVQYDRSLGLSLSVLLLVPYLIMLAWARLDSRWRITHNEFEHHSFGRIDDSLGRGAKTIRTSFPDMFELLLGLAGTLVVYNATGTRELRRIPHVMFLPFIRRRLNRILETTSVTAGQMEEEEEDDQQA
jgi:hypothetical protein